MEEMIVNALKGMNEEQRADFISWLDEGNGHAVAEVKRYTRLGLPEEWLAPMVNREWSNFVQVFDGMEELGDDAVTGQPIAKVNGRWAILLTPDQQEKGYLDNGWGIWTQSRTRTCWVDLVHEVGWDEDEDDEWDFESNDRILNAIKVANNIHPDAEYWNHRFMNANEAEEHGYDVPAVEVEFNIPLGPDIKRNYIRRQSDEEIEYMITEVDAQPYFIKYEGTKRVDYFNPKKYAYFLVQSKRDPVEYEERLAHVKKQQEKHPNRLGVLGGAYHEIKWRKDGEQRPAEDIAAEMVEADAADIKGYAEAVERYREQIPGIDRHIKLTEDMSKFNYMCPPGWVEEMFQPRGYVDVMWNHNYMTPWVDGIPNTTVLGAVAEALGVKHNGDGCIGRGFAAQAKGRAVKKFLEDTDWLNNMEEEMKA